MRAVWSCKVTDSYHGLRQRRKGRSQRGEARGEGRPGQPEGGREEGHRQLRRRPGRSGRAAPQVNLDVAFEQVDRAAFIPARIWFDDENGRPQPIDRAAEPVRWRAAVERDAPIVTQLDD